MGSVKDLIVSKKPEKDKSGIGQFFFSDRYSVFDWGEMPDHIPKKGVSLCLTSAYFFEKLEEMGIKTHYRGLLEDGKLKKLKELKHPTNYMEVELLRVLSPEINKNEYDYSIYKKEHANFLIPFEIIYRNSLPPGSSIFQRLKEGTLALKDFELNEMPFPGQTLAKPFLDISTKLERSDRYISWEGAKGLTNLSEDELQEIKRITSLINKLISEEVEKIGIINEDGKVEFGFNEQRELVLLDVVGTLDECRFTFKGLPLSKEIARISYRETPWYQDLKEAEKKDKIKWKELVTTSPPLLPPRIKKLISMLYCAFTNEITQREWFRNIPPLKEISKEIKKFL